MKVGGVTSRFLLAYLVCTALSYPLMLSLLLYLVAHDVGKGAAAFWGHTISEAAESGQTLSDAEMRELVGTAAKAADESLNPYKIATQTSVLEFLVIGVLWAVIAGEWRRSGIVPLTTLLFGNVLSEGPIRAALSVEQRLFIFLCAQLVVCYLAAFLARRGAESIRVWRGKQEDGK